MPKCTTGLSDFTFKHNYLDVVKIRPKTKDIVYYLFYMTIRGKADQRDPEKHPRDNRLPYFHNINPNFIRFQYF